MAVGSVSIDKVLRDRGFGYMLGQYRVVQNRLGRYPLFLIPRNSKEWHGYSGRKKGMIFRVLMV